MTFKTRTELFKAMSSHERKALIRKKMKAQGLEEGSGVRGKSLNSYDRDEIWNLIQVTSCFPEMKLQQSTIKEKNYKKIQIISWILIAITIVGAVILYYEQYPVQEIRRELSVDGIFWD